MKQLIAIILAGGIGKRLWPLSLDKSLTPFLGRPIIEYTVDDLIRAGIDKFIIITNVQNDKEIKTLVSKKTNINFQTIVQLEAKGMADAILRTEKLINHIPMLVVNSSDLFVQDVYRNYVAQIDDKGIVLGGLKVDRYLEGGYFILKNDRVVGLVEKPGSGREPSKFFNLVIDYFKIPQQLFVAIKQASSSRDDVYEVALDSLIKTQKVNVFKVDSYFQQIKYPWHILEMMTKIFKDRSTTNVSKKAKISHKATIEGKVVIAGGAQVMAGAIVKGPAFIGENTIIGNNVLVRESMIGKNCVVGFGSEVARSWVGDNNWFHCNYIGDSVIENSCNFGSGARTANLRFDGKEVVVKRDNKQYFTGLGKLGAIVGKDVKVGINTSLMPGVLLGKNSFVGAGMVLNQNIEDNKVCYKKTNLVIKKKVIK